MRSHNALRRTCVASGTALAFAIATAGAASAQTLPIDPIGTVSPAVCPLTGLVGECVTETGVTVPGTGITVPGTDVRVPGPDDLGSGQAAVLPGGSTATGNSPSTGGAAGPDTRRPRTRIGARRARLSLSLRRGYIVTVACDEACTIDGRLTRAGSWSTLARGKARLNGPGKVKVKLRFTRAARRALKRKRSVKVTIRVTVADAAGNAGKRTKRITLKR